MSANKLHSTSTKTTLFCARHLQQITVCPEKWDRNVFCNIFYKSQTWSNLVQFPEQICHENVKFFPPHLNNASIIPCETWNAHHAGATTALSEKAMPEFIPLSQVGSCRHCGSHSSVASSIAMCVLYTSLAILTTLCYQLNSNLVNLEATVEVGYILEFLYLTTQL